MIRATATLRTAGLDSYIARLPGALDDGAEAVAQRTAVRWRELAHVVTGSYRASIFVQTHDHSDYAEHASAAQALNPHAVILPEPPRPARKGAASVGSAVEHAMFEELGTSTRPAHPAFTPAVELARADLRAEIQKRIAP